MKYLFFVLVFAALAFANNDGCTDTSAGVNPHTSGSDGITLTLVNDWTLAEKALGLDIWESPSTVTILGADNEANVIRGYDVTGSPIGTIPLSAANGSCFGVAWNNNLDTTAYYTDDWSDNVLYYTEDYGTSWTTVANPAGSSARGMDFDGTDYWTTNGVGGGLWRFQPGVGAENIAIPEISGHPSGVTVFPYNGNLGVAVSVYTTYNIFFYEWDGSTMSYIGFAPCPASCSSSFGLAYSATNGNIYWSYNSGSSYMLAEFSFSITALERSSWGSIKSSF